MPREFQDDHEWSKVQRKPAGKLVALVPAGTSIRSFGWHRTEGKDEAVVGFMVLPSDQVPRALAQSGNNGLFLVVLPPKDSKVVQPPQSVRWVPRDETYTAAQYLQSVRELAETARTGVAFRRGGRANLGLIGEAADAPSDGIVRKRWVARGVPTTWLPGQFEELLTKNHWRVLKDITPPARPRGLWTFQARSSA